MTPAPRDPASETLSIVSGRREIVFIENNVADFATVAQSMGTGREVVVLDASQDGLAQIVLALEGRSDIDAVHIVTHGSAGKLSLGTLELDEAAMQARAADLKLLGSALAEGGDVLLYGCDVAAGSRGAAFLDQLAIVTGADVAASDNQTGSSVLGGDWELEVQRGEIETAPAVSAELAALYQHTFKGDDAIMVDFSERSNFVLSGGDDAEYDVSYKVAGNEAHQLVVDGATMGVTESDQVVQVGDLQIGAGTGVTLSFSSNLPFTPSSLELLPMNVATATMQIRGYRGDVPSGQPLELRYDAASAMGDPLRIGFPFDEFVNITKLVITPVGEVGTTLPYLQLDNFGLQAIGEVVLNPQVVTVTTPNDASGIYKAGDTIRIDVTFDRSVEVSGTPELALATGNEGAVASFVEVVNGTTLRFAYTVRTGDNTVDADYAGTAALTVTGGTIKAAGTEYEAVLTLPESGIAVFQPLVIDTIAPAAPATPVLDPASDSGESSSDGITGDASPTFQGAAGSVEGGATVTLYAGGMTLTSVVANADGSWEATAPNLADGTYAITAVATDAAGNRSFASSELPLTIDTAAPMTYIATLAMTPDTGLSNDFITRTADVAFSGTLSAPLEADERVLVSIDGGASFSPATISAGETAWSFAATLGCSSTVVVLVEDRAGNRGSTKTQDFVLDTTRPAAPSAPDLVCESDTGLDDADNITGDTQPVFSGTGETGSTVTLFVNGVSAGKADVVNGSWTIQVEQALAAGTYDVTAIAIDAAGNTSEVSGALIMQVITAKPASTVTSIAISTDTGISTADGITSQAQQEISGTLSEELGANEYVEVSVDGVNWETATVHGTLWALDTSLSSAGDKILARVANAVGNSSDAMEKSYQLLANAPVVSVTSNPASLKAGETAEITFTFTADPGDTFNWDGETGDLDVTGGTLSAITGSGLTRTATFTPLEDTDDGIASITVHAEAFQDAAGNLGEASCGLTLPYDTKAPAAPTAPVMQAGHDSGDSQSDLITKVIAPLLYGQAPEGTTVYLYDAHDNEIASVRTSGTTYSLQPKYPFLAHGEHTIRAVAVDAAGNRSEASAGLTFTVDSKAPTIDITSDVPVLKVDETATITFTFDEDPGARFAWDGESGSITVTGGTLSAIQGEGLTRTATFTPTPGMNDGAPTITLVPAAFTDVAGNLARITTPLALTYDTLAPDAPCQLALDCASDTGLNNADGITAETTPTFTGTAEAGVTVTLTAGATLLGSTVATGGSWSITSTVALTEGEYQVTAQAIDAAGNVSVLSDAITVTIVTTGPETTVTDVTMTEDSGISSTDFITNVTCGHVLSGRLTAELGADEYLRVSVDDGASWTQVCQIDGLDWSVELSLLASGTIRVEVANLAGAPGPAFTQDYEVITAAPTVELSSSRETLRGGQTATITLSFSADPGESFTAADLVATGGTLGEVTGSGKTREVVFTPTPDTEFGCAMISVLAESYIDLAGNFGIAPVPLTLTYDTLAPAAPAAPVLAAESDTGTLGDGRTLTTSPVIEGTADAGATVMLYNGNVLVGTTEADCEGIWSIETTLATGRYNLTAVQLDAAGNSSAPSQAFALNIERPASPAPAPSTPLVDGMPVSSRPVTLPGGVTGTSVNVPVVPDTRSETNGTPGVADIPLQSGNGNPLLLAQIPSGYGLSASGANVGVSNLEALIAAIRAATPTHAANDQGHLTGNGQNFLDQLAASNLLVETVNIAGNGNASAPLTLSGTSTGEQGTALVLDGSAAPGASIVLQGVDFAAAIGAMSVTSRTNNAVLTGDAASQQFDVLGSNAANVFAGGGADTLVFNANAASPDSADGATRAQVTGPNLSVLHAGEGEDVASFAGNRADWNVEEHNGYFVVSSKADPLARALVVNAEQLKFDDETVAVAPNAAHDTIAGLYDHVMGRQADLYGFEWWADARDAGNSWGQVAMWMIDSSERANGFNGDNAHDIELLYQALFDRTVDDGGLAFWMERMDEGLSLLDLATYMVESAEMVGYRVAAPGWDFTV